MNFPEWFYCATRSQ